MLYCQKCHGLCESGTPRCPNCKNTKLRAVDAQDMVMLHRAEEYTANRMADRFDAAGIIYRLEPAATGLHTPLYDSTVMPTDKVILVRYADLKAAEGFSHEVQDELEREWQVQEEEPTESKTLGKRLIVESVAVILFMLLVMAAVFGTDAFANWLKTLLQGG